ncbi:hypothetical protein ALC53_01618 [Atta colombica]|uniref:Uncharacterized protein n=1 Tax=Atta colombica TaxID=520822 RepID=A0A195BTE2_9HYME|nr:hypothetical protein ALC53_01618 [Atta colombica]
MHERNYEHRWAPTALSLAISEIAFGVAYVSHIPSLQGGLRDVCRRSPYHILFHRFSRFCSIVFYGDTVNPVGLIAVDSVSVSRINLTDAQRWYREKEEGCIYKGKGGRSGTSDEQERRSHVVHFRNTLTAQSQPEGTWSVERMALSDVGVA